MHEVMAGAGAHEGCVGQWWHIERGPGMSEGLGCVQRNGAHPGWSWGDSLRVAVCGAVRLDVGVVKKMRGWGQDACT